jgi:hypothetical protein
MNIDSIITSVPADSTAGRVISSGFKYSPNKKIACHHWDICPELEDLPKSVDQKHDLRGVKFGRMTVIGRLNLAAIGKLKPSKKGALWVCRCSCGHYETRYSKSIKNKANQNDRCQLCRHLAYLKRKEIYRRTGKDIPPAIDIFP